MALLVLDKEALWAGGDAVALVQAGGRGTGCAVVCRWPSTAPAGGMTLFTFVRVIREAVCRTSGCADAIVEVTGLQQERFLWFEAEQAV